MRSHIYFLGEKTHVDSEEKMMNQETFKIIKTIKIIINTYNIHSPDNDILLNDNPMLCNRIKASYKCDQSHRNISITDNSERLILNENM